MVNIELIQKLLPNDLWDLAGSYVIGDIFLENNSGLIEMILRSKSIESKEEKQNWFNLLPMMNTDQVTKLTNILVKEKEKLAEIEQKYQRRKAEIKDKYVNSRQEMGYIKKVSEIKKKEEVTLQKDEQEAEDLLTMI